MRFVTLLCISFMLILSAHAQYNNDASTITGRAAVLEGDTIEINNQKIRLHGIDALNIGKHAMIDEDFFIAAVSNQRQRWTYFSGAMKLPAVYYLPTNMVEN